MYIVLLLCVCVHSFSTLPLSGPGTRLVLNIRSYWDEHIGMVFCSISCKAKRKTKEKKTIIGEYEGQLKRVNPKASERKDNQWEEGEVPND